MTKRKVVPRYGSAHLITSIANSTGMDRRDISEVLRELVVQMTAVLQAGAPVVLDGFGTFRTADLKSMWTRRVLPSEGGKPGDRAPVGRVIRVFFKKSKPLQEALSDKRKQRRRNVEVRGG